MRPGVEPFSRDALMRMSDVSFINLRKFTGRFGLELHHPQYFQNTPDGKHYSAVAKISASYDGEPAGTITLVTLVPGDGTGDITPTTPRKKKRVYTEILFPLGTFDVDLDYHNYNSLLEIGLDKREEVVIRNHGLSIGDFCKIYNGDARPTSGELSISETLECPMYTSDFRYRQFGNPHSIYAHTVLPQSAQIAAFIPITDENLNTFGRSIANFTSMRNHFMRPNFEANNP